MNLPWIALRTLTGVCALFVSIHGLWNLYGLDFRIDTIVSVLYCLLPFLSFFIFLFVRTPRFELALHAIVAAGYLWTFSLLDWRSCEAFGFCTTFAATTFEALRTRQVLAAFAVVLLSAIALMLDARLNTGSRSSN